MTIPTTGHVWAELSGQQVYGPLIGRAQDLAGEARAFHWPLEFPEAFAAGGFDVVLGNPPWEVMQLGEEEYFAQRDPEIASLTGAARKSAIAALERERPALFAEYVRDKRAFDASNEFARASSRFNLSARGKVNTYALFADLASQLIVPSGRLGIIVPTGIATDFGNRLFFDAAVRGRRLVSFLMFDNQKRVFPAVHPDTPFGLMTIGAATLNPEFAAYLLEEIDLGDRERRFSLTPEQISAINPNTRTAPIFRSRADAELTAGIYARVPVLIEQGRGREGNSWQIEFRQGLFNMTSDSGLFRTATQLGAAGYERRGVDWVKQGLTSLQSALNLDGGRDGTSLDLRGGSSRGDERYVPLYEAKMVHLFDHRWATYEFDGKASQDVTLSERADLRFEPAPRYWVPESEVNERLAAKSWTRGWLMGWRDITNATNERTVIAAAFPRSGVGNNLPLMLFELHANPRSLAALQGNLSSLTCDYVARHKVGGTHLNFFIYEQLPVLASSTYSDLDFAFIVPRLVELTYTSYSLTPFARDLGYEGPPFGWNEDRRALLRAELDAFYARAYGLTRDELRYILDPADIRGPDYPSETFRVLKTNEIARYGEYRTARLVLDAWDRMERGELK